MKSIAKPLVVLFICIVAMAIWTRGFQAFTVFSYTLESAGPLPRPLPRFSMIDHEGRVFDIHDKKKYVLLNFVYLNCPYVCHLVNNRLDSIYKALGSELIPDRLELVTFSFDLMHDNVRKINNYRNHFGNSTAGWTFAIPNHAKNDTLQEYLLKTGVWAKAPADRGIINHSIYLFLISPENKIIQVFDPARQSDRQIIEGLKTWIKK